MVITHCFLVIEWNWGKIGNWSLEGAVLALVFSIKEEGGRPVVVVLALRRRHKGLHCHAMAQILAEGVKRRRMNATPTRLLPSLGCIAHSIPFFVCYPQNTWVKLCTDLDSEWISVTWDSYRDLALLTPESKRFPGWAINRRGCKLWVMNAMLHNPTTVQHPCMQCRM
jgi:hypothetical protein